MSSPRQSTSSTSRNFNVYEGERPEASVPREHYYYESNRPGASTPHTGRESSRDHFLTDDSRTRHYHYPSNDPNNKKEEETKEEPIPVKAADRRGSVVNPWTAAAASLTTQRVGTGNEEAAQNYKSSYLNKLLNFFR